MMKQNPMSISGSTTTYQSSSLVSIEFKCCKYESGESVAWCVCFDVGGAGRPTENKDVVNGSKFKAIRQKAVLGVGIFVAVF